MSDPICDPTDLATYLNIVDIDNDRAILLLADAQALCESILTPLPAAAAPIVRRIAARGYTNITSAHSVGLGTGNITYGAPNAYIGLGGIYLSQTDQRDLRRLAGGGGAFSIDTIPADYKLVLPPWDQGVYGSGPWWG